MWWEAVMHKKLLPGLHYIFLLSGLGFGLLFVFLIPPLHGNDEIVHFPRAYHVAEGNLRVEYLGGYDYGGYVPAQIKTMNDGFRELVQNDNPSAARIAELKRQYSQERLNEQGREPLAFTSAGVYSAWSYLPSAAGVKLAKFLDLPLIWYIYMARIMCLAVWVGLTFLALKLLPIGKPLLFAVALLPTSVVQAVTMGMDGIVNGLSWLIIALTLAVMTKKVRLTAPAVAAFALLSTYLATTKQGYVLLAAFPLVIPAALYPVKQKAANYIRIGFGLFLVLLSVWYFRQTAPIADVMHFIQRPGLDVDSAAQWRYILDNPLTVLLMIITQPFSLVYAGVYAGVVGVITNRLLYLSIPVIGLLYIGLAAAFASGAPDKNLQLPWKRLRIAGVATLLGTFTLISLALYVSFTQVGHPHVEGIQGRYFLPLVPLLAVWAPRLKPKRAEKFQQYTLPAICLISLAGLLSAAAALL
jgi:uncharacterized membrane protein